MKINVEKIHWLRIEQGLSLTTLCTKSKISKSTMTRLLKSKCDTRPDTIGKVAKGLNVPVKDLFFDE
ncbi:helix-turn-helix domain-containing protein [Clostridium thailandense]|uniref:helix-turn-helix domain-containing protein n=1 Tax=Clostridium thailandense TaxID=2794346 RepID=UPI003989DAE7